MPPLPDLARWFDVHEVDAVLVDEDARPMFRVVLEAMGWDGEVVRDVWVYRRGPKAILPGQSPLPFVQPFVVGEPAPPITMAGLDGDEVRLSDLRDRPTVLVFLASWCLNGCADQIAGLRNLLAEETAVEVVAVMMSDSPDDARGFLDRSGLSIRAALDPDGVVFLGTGSAIIPTTVVIDADGVVRRILVDPLSPDAYPRAIANILARAAG